MEQREVKPVRNVLEIFDFQNGQPKIFESIGDTLSNALGKLTDLKYVVVMNHLDRCFYIARTTKLATYMGIVASFMNGSYTVYMCIDLQRRCDDRNLRFWSAEVLDARKINVATIRNTLKGWKEVGSKSHISRLGAGDSVIYKIIHKRTGWARYASHHVERVPIPQYTALQAICSIWCKLQKKLRPCDTHPLIREYKCMFTEIENNLDSFKIEVIETIKTSEENRRPVDVVRKLNIAIQTEWENSQYVKDLMRQ